MKDLVYIGLGTNLGDREAHLRAAVTALSAIDAVTIRAHSSLYESAPVGPAQPRFLNAVVALDCQLSPRQLLGILKQIEADLGRVPAERWGPRVIDLDILLFGERVEAEPRLQIPHLELHQRRFALEPLVELHPAGQHPILKRTLASLLADVRGQDVRRWPSSSWPLFSERRMAELETDL